MHVCVALCAVAGVLALAMPAWGSEADMVAFWASRPVAPGETAMLAGSGLDETTAVAVERLADGDIGAPSNEDARIPSASAGIVEPAQVTERSVKFVLPEAGKPGLYTARVSGVLGKTGGRSLNEEIIA